MIKFIKTIKNFFGRPRYSGNVDSTRDYYNNTTVPGMYTLLREYKRVVYTCSNINAERCASIPLKLYVMTSSDQKEPRVKRKTLKSFQETQVKAKFSVKSGTIVEEVVEHPILDLLYNPRGPYSYFNITNYDLRLWTEIFLQLTGFAYWRIIDRDVFGLPIGLEILPSHLVTAEKDKSSGFSNPIDFYIYNNPYTDKQEVVTLDNMVVFKGFSPYDIYADSISDLKASYEDVAIGSKVTSVKNNILDSNGVPDTLISPKLTDGSWGPDISKRMEHELMLRFARGKGGGVYVTEDPLDINKLGLGFDELATLELDERNVTSIANVFRIPISLLINKTANKATLEAALTQLALLSITPRLDRHVSVLNSFLIPVYDKSGRLFFGYDSPVPEDRTIKLQENVQLCMNGIKTPNEVREEYGYKPLPDGDVLRPINVSPEIVRQDKRDDGTAEQ